jgi:hypothetical protein
MIGVDVPNDAEFADAMTFLKDAIHSQFFMETAILLCWAIWTTRNALIFNDIQPELTASRAVFVREMKMLCHRVNSRSSQAFEQWLQQIL